MTRALEQFLKNPRHIKLSSPVGASREWSDAAARLADSVASWPAVKADAAWRWYWQAETSWSLEDGPDQFGRVRLPFPQMVIEGAVPRSVWLPEKGWTPSTHAADVVVFMQEMNEGSDNLVICCSVLIRVDGVLVLSPTLILVSTDASGILQPVRGGTTIRVGDSTEVIPAPPEATYFRYMQPAGLPPDGLLEENGILDAVRPALLAVALMHCRNTQLVIEEVPEKVRRKRLSTGKPTIEWRTIQVPSPTSQSSRLTKSITGPKVPLHMVRGHFKTYTEEAPLFGQATGTYWWSNHTRGDIAAGERRHLYVVRSGKHENEGPAEADPSTSFESPSDSTETDLIRLRGVR